ncbi:hypothetical protein GUITHDRAFT_100825 [Guillardia theta CCMP2712]|uniref:Uncharacterized protein n=1 Tax=Guillardia theta (strain CCMP2712) TaxID=905079 RepID=L1JZZ5_GUITC|nr:hypothetical protein GUITHDRAFT_100825 [Guillardia theta CCMP2712]EKX53859.1 hypothetical protein GUITHDRAFT_100825 [Guillardia theta CCMP2712]|eukprot:XP_005840839.1 hypothetical protein GUITHDRAFT_100825 [Guillardia theta CCMP2712]
MGKEEPGAGGMAWAKFGKEEWGRYFGLVPDEPALPRRIKALMGASCPIWKGKKVCETHLLVLVPSTLNSRRMCMNLMAEVMQAPKEGNACSIRYYWDKMKAQRGLEGPEACYWILIAKDILPRSTNKLYQDQQALARALQVELVQPEDIKLVQGASYLQNSPYKMPTALEMVITMVLWYASTGERLLKETSEEEGGKQSWTNTRCRDELLHGCPIVVGSFRESGMCVYDYHSCGTDVGGGVVVCMKLDDIKELK